jgi:hypothetical protein
MAVKSPTEAALSIGTPDAIATPIDSGNATKKTTKEASKSSFQVLHNVSALTKVRLDFTKDPLELIVD